MAKQGRPGANTNVGTPAAGTPPVRAEATPGATTPPVGSEGDKTAAGTPPALPALPPATAGKKRMKCADLKGGRITVGRGEIVPIDENGLFEVDEREAARLLTIPGYEEA